MHITKAIIKNYRCLENSTVPLNPQLNIIVGNNECGKSTLLEAISLALSGQVNGRPIQTELHPHLFNVGAVDKYIKGLRNNPKPAPRRFSSSCTLLTTPGLPS
jgi:predicted ATPase